jgi:hypothetical protein
VVRTPFGSVRATAEEVARPLPGDDLVAPAHAVMDRAFTLPVDPATAWPWLVQLGKGRAGWYLPRSVERFVPPSRRATRRVEDRWQDLAVGEVIPDWGGRQAYFEVARMEPPHVLVHRSTRGHTHLTWAIVLRDHPDGTRVQLRLRLAPVRRVRLAETLGDAVDALTVAGMAAGLRERLDAGRDPNAG